jgi:predicted metal-dependent peptidase
MCVATAAVRLMLHYPFWCELYYTLKVVESYAVKTLATDGKRLWVNPEFFNGLTLEFKVAALAHEVCHKMLHHCTRGRTFREPYGNIAADVVVNTLLHDNGFKIHPKWVQPEAKYRGWTFEAIYHDIISKLQPPPPQPPGGQGTTPPPEEDDDQQDQPGGGSGEEDEDGDEEGQGKPGSPEEEQEDGEGEGEGDQGEEESGGSGYCDDPGVPDKYRGAWKDVVPFKGSHEEAEAFEEKVEQQVQQAIATAKMMGNAPAGVEMEMEKVTKVAEEKWFDHLQRFFQSLRLAEYDWKKLNRRMIMKHRLVAPTQYTERLGPVVLFVDASGSCWSQAIQANFASHINAILSEAKPERTVVAFFDTMVHKTVEVEPGCIEFEEPPAGGGGTSIRWMQEWLDECGVDPAVVIVLTDMYIDFPTEEPTYPVIWASTSPNMPAPFGDTIYIN